MRSQEKEEGSQIFPNEATEKERMKVVVFEVRLSRAVVEKCA